MFIALLIKTISYAAYIHYSTITSFHNYRKLIVISL